MKDEKKHREMCYSCDRLMWCEFYQGVKLCPSCFKEAVLDSEGTIEASAPKEH